jgi:hypothetical protein
MYISMWVGTHTYSPPLARIILWTKIFKISIHATLKVNQWSKAHPVIARLRRGRREGKSSSPFRWGTVWDDVRNSEVHICKSRIYTKLITLLSTSSLHAKPITWLDPVTEEPSITSDHKCRQLIDCVHRSLHYMIHYIQWSVLYGLFSMHKL